MTGNGNIPLLLARQKPPHEWLRKNTRLCVLPPLSLPPKVLRRHAPNNQGSARTLACRRDNRHAQAVASDEPYPRGIYVRCGSRATDLRCPPRCPLIPRADIPLGFAQQLWKLCHVCRDPPPLSGTLQRQMLFSGLGFSNSGSLATLAAMRRASSLVTRKTPRSLNGE